MRIIPVRSVNEITSFTFADECMTVEHCNRLIDICQARRNAYAKLVGAPNKREVGKRWNHKIHAVKVRREALIAEANHREQVSEDGDGARRGSEWS